MNFKGFLKSRCAYLLEEILNESPEEDNFKKQAYRRVFKGEKFKSEIANDPEKAWRAVLNKASYKLTKGSDKTTRAAVAAAKGAVNQAKQRNINTELKDEETENFGKSTSDKILKHAEDWSKDDFTEFKDTLTEPLKSKLKGWSFFDFNNTSTNNVLADLNDEEKEELFNAMKEREKTEDNVEEKTWKDKTVEDLEGLSDDDFTKIKDKLKDFFPDKSINSLEDLKNLQSDVDSLDDNKKAELDKLLEPKPQQTPAEPQQTGETPPSTQNQEALKRVQELQKAEKLAKKLRDNNIPTKEDGSPDFDNPDTFKKINDLMVNGDDELYNEYIRSKGIEQSEIAQQIKARTEQENALIKQDLENRQARREHEVESQKRLCNFALALDIICSALTRKSTDVFSTLAEKRGQAKAMEQGLEVFTKEVEEDIKKAEQDHAKELDSIDTHERLKLEQLEKDRANPTATVAYKRKSMEILKQYNAKKEEHNKQGQALNSKMEQNAKISTILFAIDNGSFDMQSLNDETIAKILPKNGGESDGDYNNRIERLKSDPDMFKEEIESIQERNQDEINQFNETSKSIDEDYKNQLIALKEDPDVKNEIKNSEADYEFKKKAIKAEFQSLRDKEDKRYADKIRVRKQAVEENKRFAKNISTLMAWSSNPQEVLATEMISMLKHRRELYNSIGEQTNDEDYPTDVDTMKKFIQKKMEEAKKGPSEPDSEKSKRPSRDPEGGLGNRLPGRTPPAVPDGTTGTGTGTGEPKSETKTEGKKSYEALKAKFNGKSKALNRFKEFLKNSEEYKDLNPDSDDVDDDTLKEALEEFNKQKFPSDITEDSLKKLGLTETDIPDSINPKDFTTWANHLKDSKNKADLDKLKEDLGFEKEVSKTDNPIDVKFDSSILSGVTITGPDGNPIALTDQNFRQYRDNPEVLKAFSKGSIEDGNTIDEGSKEDTKQDPTEDEAKKKLSNYSLKTLWKILAKNNISIRTLEGYKQGMSIDEKRDLIAKFLNKNKKELDFSGTQLPTDKELITESKHRKTAFNRLNEVSKARKRISEKRSFKKFSELLVHDVRTYGV